MRNSAGKLVTEIRFCFSNSCITPVSLALYVRCKCLLKTQASACWRTDAILVVYVDESIKDAEWNATGTAEDLQFKNLIWGHKNEVVEKISQGIK